MACTQVLVKPTETINSHQDLHTRAHAKLQTNMCLQDAFLQNVQDNKYNSFEFKGNAGVNGVNVLRHKKMLCQMKYSVICN